MPNATEKLPEVKHSYQNHSMDSLRWNFFSPRADDIVVATSIRAGTTWVLAIVGNLISSGKRTSAAQAQARLGQVAECNKGTAVNARHQLDACKTRGEPQWKRIKNPSRSKSANA